MGKITSFRGVTQALERFLDEHHDGVSPLLVAVSGGSDSLTLLYALAESSFKKFGEVVHVDHGWRGESVREAAQVEELCAQLDLPCHRVRVSPNQSEEGARNQRLQVYRRLLSKTGAQAVLLAHHRDDLAETTFKRLVEGAPLPKLAGIRPVSVVEEVPLWRPFLGLSKGELAHFPPISVDSTNGDPRYHRGLLRSQVFPYLEEALGRPLAPNLAYLAGEAALLTDYLDREAIPYLSQMKRGPLGLCLDLSNSPHPFLLSHLIRCFSEEANISLSRQEVETAQYLIQTGAANRFVHGLGIDRGRLFHLRQLSPCPSKPLPLAEGTHLYGPWRVEVREAVDEAPIGWEGIWKGRVDVLLPAGNYSLIPYPGGRQLSRLLTAQKVPACLRLYFPTLIDQDTGRRRWWIRQPNRAAKWSVSLTLIRACNQGL